MLHPVRTAIAAVVLGGSVYAGARSVGPLPALGPFLDPVHGVWSTAHELPANATGTIPGLGAGVRVVYDHRAVPHIFATTELDAYRALGYVVARDRLFQLYVQNMAATGRLSELGGRRALELDREMRRIGFPRAAEQKFAALSPDARALAVAYADGINAYVGAMRPGDLPLEFRLLGRRPEKWEPINSIHLMNRMGYTLAYLTPEVDRALAASRVGRVAAASLFPEREPIQEPIQPNGQTAPRYDFEPLAPPGAPDSAPQVVASLVRDLFPASAERLAQARSDGDWSGFASNNWAVAPQRSASGHALLAGDPHLELTLPSIWYEVHLVVPGKLDVYGVTIPGAPGVVIGFNRDVAWTFTNTGADVLDFYRETVDDELHPTRYQVDGAWRPLDQRVERYRDQAGRVIATDTVYYTHRGPMHRERRGWLSMRWTVLEPGNEAAAFMPAARAHSAAEFESVMAGNYKAPAQNMLAADRSGTIAIRSTGRFPIRPGDGSGLVIRDGSRSANDWTGELSVAQYPQGMNPAQGYLASANQQPVDPRTVSYYVGGWYDQWRALRINHLLRADSQVTVDAMRRFQTDPGSERAEYFVPYFLAAARTMDGRPGIDAARLRDAAKRLAAWDRRYTLDARGPVLFEAAMTELVNRTWDELVDPRADSVTVARRGGRVVTPNTTVLAELLADSASIWWDDRRTTARTETRDEILATSLVAALDRARREHGDPNGDGWLWRNARHANIYHLLRLPALSALDLSVAAGPSALWPLGASGTQGPSWRMVVELGPTVRAWATYPGGQSGNPASAHYTDNLPKWTTGVLDSLVVPAAADSFKAGQALGTLTLEPRR